MPIHNLAETQLAAVRGRKIGFVFQSYQLIQTLTALENVLLPYELNLEGATLGPESSSASRSKHWLYRKRAAATNSNLQVTAAWRRRGGCSMRLAD